MWMHDAKSSKSAPAMLQRQKIGISTKPQPQTHEHATKSAVCKLIGNIKALHRRCKDIHSHFMQQAVPGNNFLILYLCHASKAPSVVAPVAAVDSAHAIGDSVMFA